MEATLSEYFRLWYGPAAESAQAYWDALEECMQSTRLLGHEDRILPFVYTQSLVEELEEHGDIEKAAHRTVKRTGSALSGAAMTTVVGFGVLMFSVQPPMQQFGKLTALTILYSFLASVYVLPSLLVLWARYFYMDLGLSPTERPAEPDEAIRDEPPVPKKLYEERVKETDEAKEAKDSTRTNETVEAKTDDETTMDTDDREPDDGPDESDDDDDDDDDGPAEPEPKVRLPVPARLILPDKPPVPEEPEA